MTVIQPSSSLNPRSDPASPWWHIDISPVIATLGLGIIGLFGIYSATRGRDDENYITTFVERQTVFLAVGLVLVVGIVFFDYRWLLRFAPMAFMTTVGVLCLVLVAGVEVNGAVSWFEFGGFRAQPSEFAKIGLIVTVAALLSQTPSGPLSLRSLIMIIMTACVPIGLVVLQPDIGTAMVLLTITAAMLMVGRAEAHHLLFDRHVGLMRGDLHVACRAGQCQLLGLGHGLGRKVANGHTASFSRKLTSQLAPHAHAATGNDREFSSKILHLRLRELVDIRCPRVYPVARSLATDGDPTHAP